MPPPPHATAAKRSSGVAWLAWVLLLLVIGGAVAFYLLRYRPLESQQQALMAAHNERGAENQKLTSELGKLRSAEADLKQKNAELQDELQKAIAEKKAALAELEKARGELSSDLESEIEAGDVHIEKREGRLVVGVADEILFATGEAEVSEKGKKLLDQIAGTLSRLKDHIIQVGGHTDDAPIVSPEVQKKYPSNWELSAARATNVVRYLQSTGIAGNRLVAAGFAQFRPNMKGTSEAARKKNRRIEIMLLPEP